MEFTLQEGWSGYAGTSDAFITAMWPDASYGADPLISVRSDGWVEGLIRFQLPALFPNTELVGAFLDLYALNRNGAGDLPLQAHRLARGWEESTVTWNTPWGTPGAAGDYASPPLDTTTVTQTGQWYTWQLTQDVRDWLAAPANNYGVILRRAGGSGDEVQFASAENSNAAYRPRLRIRYRALTTPTATPTRPIPTRSAFLPLIWK